MKRRTAKTIPRKQPKRVLNQKVKDDTPSNVAVADENAELLGSMYDPLQHSNLEGYSLKKPDVVHSKLLAALVTQNPGSYSFFLALLIRGSSLTGAIAVLGHSAETVKHWYQRGLLDEAALIDSYEARLARDVKRACLLAAGRMEQLVGAKDPYKWLTKGPGKSVFAGTPYWQDDSPTRQAEDSLTDDPLNPLVEHATTEDDSSTDDDTDNKLAQAVDVLASTGILGSAEMTEQLRQQHRIGYKQAATTASEEKPQGEPALRP